MTQRFNPPPGWPVPPTGFQPPAGWRPDPSWPAPPPGWQLWVDDRPAAAPPHPPAAHPATAPPESAPPESAIPGPHPHPSAAGSSAVPAAHHPRPGERHGLLHLLIAVSIGLVSVLGAAVVWRAETHAANADAADQNAISASITAAHLRSTAEQAADTAQRKFARYQRLGLDSARLDPGHDCDNRNDSPTTVTQIDAAVDCDVQIVFSGYADETSKQGSYDVTTYTNDVLAFTRYFQPQANPAPFEQQAETQRNLEHKLLWLSIGLVGVLALFTLARLGRTETECLVLAVPGWALFASACVALVLLEL